VKKVGEWNTVAEAEMSGKVKKREKTKPRVGFFTEGDGAPSMRRLAAFMMILMASFSLFYCTLFASPLALSSARLALAFAALFLGLTTGETVAAVVGRRREVKDGDQ
jgi:hypothetical protein